MDDEVTGSWHLSKTVPLSIILALLIQTLGIVWWARGLDSRVGNLETSQVDQNTRILTLEAATNATAKELAVIAANQNNVIKRLDANGIKLDQLLSRPK